MIWRLCISMAGCLLVSGCATGPDSTADARDDVRCQKYTPTGSHIPHTRCASVEQLEREREAAQEFIKKRTQQTTTGGAN